MPTVYAVLFDAETTEAKKGDKSENFRLVATGDPVDTKPELFIGRFEAPM